MDTFAQSTKRLLTPLIFFTLALLLIACGSQQSVASTSSPSPSPQASPTPSATATATPQLTQQYEFTEQESGKAIVYTVTSRFTIILNAQKYPKENLQVSCDPVGAIGSISNLPYVAPPLYAVRYQGVQPGTCTIRNGDFLLMVKIIALPD